MSTQLIFVICGVIALVLLLTVVLILTRYKKCKSNELLVVYGKTKGNTTCKCYHGGSAFVWPVIQGYSVMSMDPFQIQCDLNGALSLQKIKVNIPTVVTVAISDKPDIMQNAAVRLLGLTEEDKVNQIKDIVWGQLRLIVAKLSVEDLISDRDKFLGFCKEDIATELEKFGLTLLNINISDISDSAEYIKNLGLEAASKAKFEALANIEKRTKEGEVGIATQKKEKQVQLSEISRDQQTEVAENQKQEAIKVAEIEKDKETSVQDTKKNQDITLREIAKDKKIQIAEREKEETVKVREVEKNREIETANLEREEAEQKSDIEKNKQITIATNESLQAQKVAEQEKLKNSEVAKQKTEAETAVATAEANRDAEIVKQRSESKQKQAEADQNAQAGIVEAEQTAEARKETAKQEAESKKVKALREKESQLAEYASQTRQRTANAEKDAKLTENNNSIEVVKSNAELGKETAESEKKIGLAQVEAQQSVEVAKAQASAKIAQEQAKAEKEKLEAQIMVGTDVEAKRKEVEAEGFKKQKVLSAEADAAEIRLKALAEAEGLKAKLLAEAEGKKALAEVEKLLKSAETENIANLAKSGVADAAQVSYILKEEYKLIAEQDAKKFEHINTGNVTVVGGTSDVGKYMLNTVEAISKVSSLRGLVPGLDGLLGKLEDFDEKGKNRKKVNKPANEEEYASEVKDENPSETESPESAE